MEDIKAIFLYVVYVKGEHHRMLNSLYSPASFNLFLNLVRFPFHSYISDLRFCLATKKRDSIIEESLSIHILAHYEFLSLNKK